MSLFVVFKKGEMKQERLAELKPSVQKFSRSMKLQGLKKNCCFWYKHTFIYRDIRLNIYIQFDLYYAWHMYTGLNCRKLIQTVLILECKWRWQSVTADISLWNHTLSLRHSISIDWMQKKKRPQWRMPIFLFESSEGEAASILWQSVKVVSYWIEFLNVVPGSEK